MLLGSGAALDLAALLQVAVLGFVLLSAALFTVRRAASRYFVVDAAAAGGDFAAYEDHHHHHRSERAMSISGEGGDGGGAVAVCNACGDPGTKKCTGCKRARYCSQACQSKHWHAEHKFKCKQMKLDNADKLSCGDEASRKRSSGFGPISLVPARRKANKVLFPYDEFLKLYNWKDPDFVPCGLLNCGNSCFANVVLQCLSCTRPLVAYLLGKDHRRECVRRHEDWCFLCELQCHVQRASESLHPFSPINILSHLPNIGGNLGFGRQEDAHEFMRFAVDKMQSACLDEYGGEKALDLNTQETTLIQHIFGGHLQSQVKCAKCGMVSNRYDNMMDLTVEIQGDAESLEECLDQFTAGEWLDGDNKYKCDGCNDYVKACKRLTVHQAPNILTITLKRFQSGRFGKLNKRITFPMKLDVTPYMSTTDGSDLYELYAVVVHLDMLNASFFGHYICYTRDYQGRWYRIDDCKVMRVDEEEVLSQGAYMLLYNRTTAHPIPLTAPQEFPKMQQQCTLIPSNTPKLMSLTEDVTLNAEASPTSRENSTSNGSASANEPSHRIDGISQELDMHLETSVEVKQQLAIAGDLGSSDFDSLPSSSLIDAHNEGICTSDSQRGDSTVSSKQFGSSPRETSSIRFAAVQCQEHAVCSDSGDYVEVDIEASTVVERWNEQMPVPDSSVISQNIVNGISRMASSSPAGETLGMAQHELDQPIGMCSPFDANGVSGLPSASFKGKASVGKPKEIFSRGFLDKPLRKRSSVGDEGSQVGNGSIAFFPKLNGLCNGHAANSVAEQEHYVDTFGGETSSGTSDNNGGMASTSNHGTSSFVNGGNKSSKDSSPADGQGNVPFVSHGFLPRPYRVPAVKDTSRNNTNDSVFETSSNGTSSFVNGNSDCCKNTSARGGQGDMSYFTRGFLTRPYRETSNKGTNRNCVHDQKTNSNGSMEQASLCVGSIVQRPERLNLDCRTSTWTNGTKFQYNSPLNENGSSCHDEDETANVVAEKNISSVKINDDDGTLDENSNSCHREDGSAMLPSEKSIDSGNMDWLKFVSGTALEHGGLRRRFASTFSEQNGIDAQ